MEVSVLEIFGRYPYACLQEVHILYGVSILNFSDYRNLFSELRSSIGHHCCWVLEEKQIEEGKRGLIFFFLLLVTA